MLNGTWTSKEFALFGTSDPDMTASRFHTHVRKHWGIEVRHEVALVE
jgi:predicted transposase YbfD/YdcC